jgi:hypothetical protein
MTETLDDTPRAGRALEALAVFLCRCKRPLIAGTHPCPDCGRAVGPDGCAGPTCVDCALSWTGVPGQMYRQRKASDAQQANGG